MPNLRVLGFLTLAACRGSAAAAPPIAVASSSTAPHPSPGGEYAFTLTRTGDVHDFDFLAGAWTLQNRRLKKRLAGSNDWEEFPAVACAQIFLGGVVNTDELKFPTKGWAGVTFRYFDMQQHQWTIRWVNSRTGTIDEGVRGGFTGDRGEFYGEDEDEGRKVKVRYLWVKHGPDHAHWEQAFSLDGTTWEVNWTSDHTRADPAKICDKVSPR